MRNVKFPKQKGDFVIMQKTYTVYKITNIINGKCYVGQTNVTLNRRFGQHKCKARNGYEKEHPIHKAINEYGENNFVAEVLENEISEADIDEREKYWIEEENSMYPNGYNVQSGGKEHFEFAIKTTNRDFKRNNINRAPHGDIIMLDKNTEKEIAIFRCATYAERFLRENGYPKANHWPITLCCMGRQKTAYGHKWKFRDDVCSPEKRTLSGDTDLR